MNQTEVIEILGKFTEFNRNQRIFRDAIIKANKNGWEVNHIASWLIKKFQSINYEKKKLYFPVIFDPAFAKAIGYSIVDLAKWTEEDKKPLLYIEKFLI